MKNASKVSKSKADLSITNQIMMRVGRNVLLVFVVIAVVAVIMMNNVLKTSKETELTLESQSMANHLAEFFSTYMSMTEQLAVNPEVREVLKATDAGESILEQTGYPTVFKNLKNMTATHPDTILATWFGDVEASQCTQSDEFTTPADWDITSRPWFACTTLGQTVLTEPYVDASTGTTIVSIASPIYDEDGKVLGVAGMDISMTQIISIMKEKKIGESGYIMLLSGEGTIIYHPNEGAIQQSMLEAAVSKNVASAITSGTEQFLKYETTDGTKYGYLAPIGDTGYLVLSCLPSSEFYQQLIVTIILLIVLFVAGIILIAWGITRISKQITKPILELNDAAQQLAAGNFDVKLQITSKDEIGQLGCSIRETVDRLKTYIAYIDEISEVLTGIADGKLAVDLKYDYAGEFQKVKNALVNISSSMMEVMQGISDTAGQVSVGSDELAHASQGLAESSGVQAAAVEDLVVIATSIAEQVEENKHDAEVSAQETANVTKMMNDSQKQMDLMKEAMNKIQETSQQVVGIITTIEEIASQTNLLALNASIEAARAGELGRGFSVVASEIGKLADESAAAVNSTRELITLSMSEIEKGNSLVEKVVGTLYSSVQAVENVNGMIQKTTENANYQASSMEQIRVRIEEISHGIQESSAIAEESSATSEELAAQSAMLNQLVQHFDLSK